MTALLPRPRLVLKPAIKREWIARLASGQYAQGHGFLNRLDEAGTIRFCCLGVLCEIAVMDHVVARGEREIGGFLAYRSIGRFDDQCSVALPYSVQQWAGINDDMGRFGTTNLAGLNDGLKLDFRTIAATIEREF